MSQSWIGDAGAAILGAFFFAASAWSCRTKHDQPVRAPFRARFAAQLHEVTGLGSPLIPRDGEPLSDDEQRVFNGYVIAESREPQKRSDAP